MRVKLLCDWKDRHTGEIIDVSDESGLELIRRDLAINYQTGLTFVIDEGYWKTKDAIWTTLKEKS